MIPYRFVAPLDFPEVFNRLKPRITGHDNGITFAGRIRRKTTGTLLFIQVVLLCHIRPLTGDHPFRLFPWPSVM